MNHKMACKACGGEVDSDGIAMVMLDEETPSEEMMESPEHEGAESTEEEVTEHLVGPRNKAFANALQHKKGPPVTHDVVVGAHPEVEEKPKKKGSSDFRSFIKGK